MNDKKREKFADFLAKECRALLVDHLESIIKAALDTQDENPKAKVSLSFAWPADKQIPKVTSRLSYNISHKDEIQGWFDSDQTMMDLDDEVEQFNRWISAEERMPEMGVDIVIRDTSGETHMGKIVADKAYGVPAFELSDGSGVIAQDLIQEWRMMTPLEQLNAGPKQIDGVAE